MATGSYMTPIYSRSQSEVLGDLHTLYGAKKFENCCQVIYSQFGLAIHQNDHQARRRFIEWAQNEIAVVPDFHKRILFSDEAHFWLNGYVNKQNCRIWSEANPQVYTRAFGNGTRNLNPGPVTWTTTELAHSSPNYHSIPTGGRLIFRQIKRASLPYTVGLSWYWDRTHDKARQDPIP
ncbi:hypothetical protein TNCV_4331511 [Trichonephila clavipes]|nr:hypothetical protein TNCV_4331511 [Trichonephila clavipes]